MKKWKVNYKRATFYLYVTHFLLFFMLLGVSFNFLAITENSGKMPVWRMYIGVSKTHFTFHNFSEVNYPWLTDIIPFIDSRFSLGDIFIALPWLILVILWFFAFHSKFKVFKRK